MNHPPRYFLKSLEFKRRQKNCSGLAACLNAAIAKIQESYTPGDKRIEAGDYVEIELGGGYCVDGIIDHVPNKSSDYWIIIEDDGCYRYFYNPPSIKLVRKGENKQ
ncbi:MAG: hypothetical protein IPK79_13825 [Vampirovibrionales bacterium]|nr:hypothetical protein [Vampirovibrionales bacterium]